jgi:hypothetical protein
MASGEGVRGSRQILYSGDRDKKSASQSVSQQGAAPGSSPRTCTALVCVSNLASELWALVGRVEQAPHTYLQPAAAADRQV